jgi:signal peptidase
MFSLMFMAWKALCLLTGTTFPIMVVTTESMEPAFQPGDVLFIVNNDRPASIGDLPVCWFPGRPFPMIHRIVQLLYHEDPDSDLRSVGLL